jgi:hypothetical protein
LRRLSLLRKHYLAGVDDGYAIWSEFRCRGAASSHTGAGAIDAVEGDFRQDLLRIDGGKFFLPNQWLPLSFASQVANI